MRAYKARCPVLILSCALVCLMFLTWPRGVRQRASLVPGLCSPRTCWLSLACWFFFFFFSWICVVFLPCSVSAPCCAGGEHLPAREGANSQRCSQKLPGGPAPLPKPTSLQRAACSWGLSSSLEAPGPVKGSCRPLVALQAARCPLRRHRASHLRQLWSWGSVFHYSISLDSCANRLVLRAEASP